MLIGSHYPPPCQFTMWYRTVTWCDTLHVSEGPEKSIIFVAYKAKAYGKAELYRGPEQALSRWWYVGLSCTEFKLAEVLDLDT